MKDFVELRRKIIDATLACNKSNFDYSFVKTEKIFWEQLSKVSNSVVVVMDIHKDEPLFISQTIFNSLGLTASLFSENISEALNRYIHPADLQLLTERTFADDVHYRFTFKSLLFFCTHFLTNDSVTLFVCKGSIGVS